MSFIEEDKLCLPVSEIEKLGLEYNENVRQRAGMFENELINKMMSRLIHDNDLLEMGGVMTDLLIENYMLELRVEKAIRQKKN